MPRLLSILSATTLSATLATPVFAEVLSDTSPSIRENLCVGFGCLTNEVFSSDFNQIMLKGLNTRIQFVDTSATSAFPTRDWSIQANDRTDGGADQLMFIDNDAGTEILTIKAGAPDSTMVLSSVGNVGLGTELPQAPLHVETTADPAIRINRASVSQTFEMQVGGGAEFSIYDITAGTRPFLVRNGGVPSFSLDLTPTGMIINRQQTAAFNLRYSSATDVNALFIEGDNGNVGMGTSNPLVPLHVVRADGSASLTVENTGGDAGVAREMFKMASNGGSFFTLDNTGSGTTWFFVHENASPNRFIITDGVADGPEMTLTADGLLTVEGGFAVGGAALNVPDYVFEAGYDLKPLSEVSAFIDANGHLPEVPSAADVARDGLDMTSMQLVQLKKIEELTLYTLEQQEIIEAQARENADLAERVARLEALLTAE
ncbi:hypothetical protein [Pacificoceanicola onchidii]|uniref:hypothetical protein n=1 Tax=Pacificoceanicola onchidii TaxID=2562685 RepID=UPI0010A5D1FF|nr:hypothetical protein [Pacificoceanicola onchidii]